MDQSSQDATVDSSTTPAAGAESPLEGATSSLGGVPAENLQGEFNRKFGKLQAQLDQVMAYMMTQSQQPQVVQAVPQPGFVSDDELWTKAQQGDREAFIEHQRRITQREMAQTQTVQNVVNLVDRQLGVLFQKYPVLRDATHPLTQAANTAYSVMIQNGYPANRATALDAAKTAIADNPQLVAEFANQGSMASEQSRRSATQVARAGVTGATHRQQPTQPTQGATKPVTTDEARLAQRMGIKDPAKAKERFQKRQDEGKSSLGAVAAFVNAEEF